MTAQPKQSNSGKYTLATLLALTATLLPALAQIPMATEGMTRKGMTEVYGIGQYLNSENINFNGPFGGSIDTKMDDTGLGGFGIAFHFSDFFSVHGDFMFGSATFSGTVPLETGGTTYVSQGAFLQTGRFNLDYNMINRRLTPVITGGIGYQYIETELNSLPPVNTCWWDPWWGWYCDTAHHYAWQTDFTWNAGAGIRWNITDNLFVKVTGGATWLEYSGAHGVTTQIEGIFAIGATF